MKKQIISTFSPTSMQYTPFGGKANKRLLV